VSLDSLLTPIIEIVVIAVVLILWLLMGGWECVRGDTR